MSSLLSGKYIAIVEVKDGSYEVSTIKSETEKKKVESFFINGKIPEGNQDGRTLKGAGTNILGFILMILLMQGVVLITLYTQDRDSRTFRRILTAPVSERLYLFVQGIFTFAMLFIPSYLAVVVTKVVFGVDIKFNFGTLAVLIGIISALSTSLALFIASVLERNYSLASSGIYIITCILSGCYISFTGSSRILDELCNILPQKAYMTLAQGVENGKGLLQYNRQLIYLLFWILALWLLGSVIIGRKMEKGVY
ncbi:MAG: ABC transporter permease [Bacillota bacterium]|nr:ABC transporter permease [Bacillota bacterium]